MDSSNHRCALVDRLKVAATAVREARLEIETLTKEKTDLINRLDAVSGGFRSVIEAQRSELERVSCRFRDTRSMLDGCLATLHSNFQSHAEKTKRALEGTHYENKLLSDQLAVKKLKITHLNKRVDAQTKHITRLKRLVARMNAGDGSGALTMRCIRCKARKNVIKSLEHELVEAYAARDSHEARHATGQKEKAELVRQLEAAKGDLARARDQLVHMRRNNAALEQDLQEEKEKTVSLEAEASTARSQMQTAVVEISRTPTDQQLPQQHPPPDGVPGYDPFAPPSLHTKCDQLAAELRSQLDKKQDELSDRERLRAELAFYQRRCEDMTMDLETAALARDQKQQELDAANRQVQLLQALLENLATGIVTAMVE